LLQLESECSFTCFSFLMHVLHRLFPLSEMVCVGFLEHYGGGKGSLGRINCRL